MDTETTQRTTDLLAEKTREYTELPGLILGLDGWILRTLPPAHRAQFLSGYERLLRVVFHPDRCENTAGRKTQENYLQSVSEAVRFMLADDYSYEITTDSVPARKNPLTSLRMAVGTRDEIIARLDAEMRRVRDEAGKDRATVNGLRRQLLREIEEEARRATLDHQLRLITARVVKKYPTPIGLKFSNVTGRFLGWKDSMAWLENVGRLSSVHSLSAEHEWIRNATWVALAERDGALGLAQRLEFKSSSCRNSGTVICMDGAMTIAHIAEYVRQHYRHPTEELSKEKVASAIAWLERPLRQFSEQEEYRVAMSPFCLPYYGANCLLLLGVRSGRDIEHRLFLVDDVNENSSPESAIAKGWEGLSKADRAKSTQLENELRTLRRTVKEWVKSPVEFEKHRNKVIEAEREKRRLSAERRKAKTITEKEMKPK